MKKDEVVNMRNRTIDEIEEELLLKQQRVDFWEQERRLPSGRELEVRSLWLEPGLEVKA